MRTLFARGRMMGAMSSTEKIARLALEDGSVFSGRAFGACDSGRSMEGEVVFNTAMCGYQEALTDPSYSGQILTMTAPEIGNYGICDEDVESSKIHVRGFVIRELSRRVSNYRAQQDLESWLHAAGVLGIEGIDTRSLVRKLRIKGAMRGVISCDESKSDNALVEMARSSPSMQGQNLVGTVSPEKQSEWAEDLGEWPMGIGGQGLSGKSLRVVALDCGAKRNIYRNLTERGCEVVILPHGASADEIRKLKPDGLFISNGPGDPDAVKETIATLREIAGEVPTFGICLGHQLLALSLGAKTYKLKFGHRGANQPVRNTMTGRVEITSQNHGFCVDTDSLSSMDCEITHLHLNDETVAGFRHTSKPIFSVQFHPEASPGPHDSAYLFDLFIVMMKKACPIEVELMKTTQFATRFCGGNEV